MKKIISGIALLATFVFGASCASTKAAPAKADASDDQRIQRELKSLGYMDAAPAPQQTVEEKEQIRKELGSLGYLK